MPGDQLPPELPVLEQPWPGDVRQVRGRISVDVTPRGLTNLAVDGQIVIAELYPALRAPDWRTIEPDSVADTSVEQPTALLLTRQRSASGRFRDRLELEIGDDLTVVVRYQLLALAPELVNRWGLNVCLNAQAWQGGRLQLGQQSVTLPSRIGPQKVVDGQLQGMFPPAHRLGLTHPGGGQLRLASAGLELEIEDQRNWTDPTYKIYSGSLRQPRPIALEAGSSRVQELTVGWQPPDRVAAPRPAGPAAVGPAAVGPAAVGPAAVGPVRPLPRIGVQLNEPGGPPEASELAAALTALGVDQVRIDAERPQVAELLAALPPIEVELAVLASQHDPTTSAALVELIDRAAAGVHLLWHLDRRRTTDRVAVAEVAAALSRPAVRVVPGTDAYFVDLNRDRPDVGPTVSFSITPSVHTSDSQTVFASLATQAEVVRQARDLFSAAVIVSPITFVVRGAPEDGHDAAHRLLPSAVERRLHTLEGAAWTLGSVHALLSGGAEAGCWHELLGPNGLLGALPAAEVRPAFHALAALHALTRPRVRAVGLPGAGWVGIHLLDRSELVLASLRPWRQLLDRDRLPVRVGVRRRLRDADLPRAAATRRWWQVAEADDVSARPELTLEPFELAVVEVTSA